MEKCAKILIVCVIMLNLPFKWCMAVVAEVTSAAACRSSPTRSHHIKWVSGYFQEGFFKQFDPDIVAAKTHAYTFDHVYIVGCHSILRAGESGDASSSLSMLFSSFCLSL